MNIGFLSSSTGWGGLERNLLRYAEWMQAAGHTAVAFVVAGTPLAARAEGAVCAIRRQVRHAPFRAARRLGRELRRRQVEVLWVRDPRDLAFAGLASQHAGIPLIFQQGMQVARPKRMPWHHRRFARVTHWVAPSQTMANQALAQTPLRPDQVSVIPLALEPEWFEAPAADARVRWQWPAEARVVGVFGRLDPLKGQADLLRALVDLPEWNGWFIGESTVNEAGDYRMELERLAREHGVDHRVRFDPPTEDLRSAYDALDAFAMCSASETFGMVTLEALTRGVPVVGTDAGGTPELLNGQPATALYPPGDAAALAAALQQVAGKQRGARDLRHHTREAAVAAWCALLAGA